MSSITFLILANRCSSLRVPYMAGWQGLQSPLWPRTIRRSLYRILARLFIFIKHHYPQPAGLQVSFDIPHFSFSILIYKPCVDDYLSSHSHFEYPPSFHSETNLVAQSNNAGRLVGLAFCRCPALLSTRLKTHNGVVC
jgi:hypothetical protein